MFDCDGPQTEAEHREANLLYSRRQETRRADEFKELLSGLIHVFRIRGKLDKEDIDKAEQMMRRI